MKFLVTGGSGFIGTNLVDYLLKRDYEVLSIDVKNPRSEKHSRVFQKVNILDEESLKLVVNGFSPTHVIHLAARTDLNERSTINGYVTNIDGVSNLVQACLPLKHLQRVVFCSSMLVCRNGYRPRSDTDYCPNTFYGQSKIEGERRVRENKELSGRWTIVRPTSIWGPWFESPYRQFFLSIAQGRYFHPGSQEVRKAFGYVGNAIYQILKLAEAPNTVVCGRTFYLADYVSYTIREWAELIQREFAVKPIRQVPLWMLRPFALAGDCVQTLGWKEPPITSFRLRNLLTPSRFDMRDLQSITGPLPFNLAEGVSATVCWLKMPNAGG